MDRWDVITLAGAGLLAGGLWLLRPWVALVVAGLLVMSVGLRGAKGTAEGDGEAG